VFAGVLMFVFGVGFASSHHFMLNKSFWRFELLTLSTTKRKSISYYCLCSFDLLDYIFQSDLYLSNFSFSEWFMRTYFLVEQVLIRLIGADEHMYTNYMEAMQWIEETDVLEMIVDKFSSSVSSINCIEPVDVSDCVSVLDWSLFSWF
jgi:hypothetical protein